MLDFISGEEPPVEAAESFSKNVGVPHTGWFLAAIVLQLGVLFFIGASRLYAMPEAASVKVQALARQVSHDKFRGNFVQDVIFNADADRVLAKEHRGDVVLIFDTSKQASAIELSITDWKMVRIESADKYDAERLSRSSPASEVALKATVSPSAFHAGKRMIFVKTAPFYLAEDVADSMQLRFSSQTPTQFELAVDKSGNASIVEIDTTQWLSANQNSRPFGSVR